MNLARYTKSIVPAIMSLFGVAFQWANTGHIDATAGRLALVGLGYAVVVFLLPNVELPDVGGPPPVIGPVVVPVQPVIGPLQPEIGTAPAALDAPAAPPLPGAPTVNLLEVP